MDELTISIALDSEGECQYNIYSTTPDEIDDDKNEDGGTCTSTMLNALEMAYLQAVELIKRKEIKGQFIDKVLEYSNNNEEVIRAYLNNFALNFDKEDAEETAENIDDNYLGFFTSDIDFAKEQYQLTHTHELSGLPNWAILDWEQIAKELMYDYFENNGHYFRSV